MAPYYSNAYLNIQVKTADRIDLVIAMYEGAMTNVNKAIESIESEDDSNRMKAIDKSSKIIMTLSDALDFSQDGGISGKLYSLYNYMLQQLLEANRTKETEPLEIVRSSLVILLDGWVQVSKSKEALEIRNQDAEVREQTGQGPGEANRPGLVMTA